MSVPAEVSFAAALQHHRAGRLVEAAGLYRSTLGHQPSHSGALFNLAVLFAQAGQLDEAAALYEQVLQLLPEDPDTLCNLGNLELNRGRGETAEACYRRAVAARPGLAAAHANIGSLCLRQGRLDEAAAAFATALDHQPDLTAARLGLGNTLWAAGRLDEARRCFAAVVAADPDHAEGHHSLAALLAEHEPARALHHYEQALAVRPGWAQAHTNLALLLARTGRSGAAARHFRQALRLDRRYMPAWRGFADLVHGAGHWRTALALLMAAREIDPADVRTEFEIGNLLHGRGQLDQAIVHYRRGIALSPETPELHGNLGSALLAIGHAEAAIAAQQRAIALNPRFVFAYNNLGNALMALGRVEEARLAYARATEIDPGFAVGLINLGNALRQQGALAEAARVLERGIALAPEDPNGHNNLGLVLQGENRHDEAIACFERALKCQPANVEALNNLAICHQARGNFTEAIRLYRDAIAIDPKRSPAYFNLGGVLQVIGRYDESVTVFKQALQIQPDYNAVYPYLAHGLMQQCSWANLDAVNSRMLSNAEAELAAGQPVSVSCFGLLGTDAPMDLRYRIARQMASRIADSVAEIKTTAALPHRVRRGGRLRIGYVSPDFRMHSVAVAFRGLLEAHDRDQFEICGYSLAPLRQDEVTTYFRQRFDRFHNVSDLSHRAAARLINDDGIDVLIDLAGHTRFTRLEIFALQPSPVQAHYLGYSSTIGGDFLQYLITDRRQIAPGAERYFAEKLVYLPDSFMATTRAEVSSEPVSRADYGLPPDGIVFCNFNAHYKFEPRLWSIWMRLLKRLPGSVLWLLNGTPTSDRNLRHEAEIRGVDPARLIFTGKEPHPRHLARQRLADIALDTLYHGGGVTTVDALWVGVPVVTVAGDSPPTRNGASLLAAIGLDELICGSIDAYQEAAFALASDPARLAAVKARLAANRDSRPLFNTRRLTRHLEEAYRLMWRRWRHGLPPGEIEVPILPD